MAGTAADGNRVPGRGTAGRCQVAHLVRELGRRQGHGRALECPVVGVQDVGDVGPEVGRTGMGVLLWEVGSWLMNRTYC